MHPLYPPYPFAELAKEHLGNPQRQARRHHPDDLDGASTRLTGRQPEPVYLGLRWLVASGPIVALSAWINRKITERGDRTPGSRIDPLLRASTVTELMVLHSSTIDDHHAPKRAA